MIFLQIAILIVGFVLLMKGADMFVDGAGKVAVKFGIPDIIIGLTIVALGTSLPEAAVSITSALKGASDLSISNIFGSNIMNVLLILGLTSLICAIPVSKKALSFDIPLVIVTTCILGFMCLRDNLLQRYEGIILIAIMILYVIYLGYRVKKGDELDEMPEKDKTPVWKMILFIILGGAMITFGSNLTVSSATAIATSFGVSERIIGLTIVAFGTSLPELVTSIAAALKKKTDIAIGNIVGSNFFNIVFVLGITSTIRPIPCESAFTLDCFAAIGAIVLLFLLALPKRKLNKLTGIIMLLVFAGFYVYTFI